ncbi:hypothetical protein ACIQNG_18470 [Streptomyces sp. NPDC091377]|uniref:hypothetical protein n=1 Tax=Streptomyces sp. NPDC091377 TaxID=3365995 RepID=UPI00381D6781
MRVNVLGGGLAVVECVGIGSVQAAAEPPRRPPRERNSTLMRRFSTAIGTLAFSGALALGIAAPAHAAHGDLTNRVGWHVSNPSGCVAVPLDNRNEFHLLNNTNEYALVYQNTSCTGPVIDVIAPGDRSNDDDSAVLGRAVYIA